MRMESPRLPARSRASLTLMALLPRAALCIILGALSTFAVAWTLGGVIPWDHPSICGTYLSPHGTTEASVHVWQATQRGAIRRSIGTYATVLWNGAAEELPPAISGSHIASDREIDTSWGRLRDALSTDASQVAAVEEARGWPMLAFWAWRDSKWTTPGTSAGGFFLEEGLFSEPWRVLPYTPIWRGFIADTVVYAGVWAGPLLVPLLLRRRVRLARSRCPDCGYDLAATGGPVCGCPECGWNRAARR